MEIKDKYQSDNSGRLANLLLVPSRRDTYDKYRELFFAVYGESVETRARAERRCLGKVFDWPSENFSQGKTVIPYTLPEIDIVRVNCKKIR